MPFRSPATGRRRRPLARRLPAVLLLGILLAACGERAAPTPRQGQLALGADTLAYRVFGTGPDTVVALGAEAFGSAYLEPLVSRLGERHTVFVLDARGRGASSWSGDSLAISVEGDVRDLNLLRQHYRISRFGLVGHHSGALVAALYARRFSERVSRLALLTPFFVSDEYIYFLSQGTPDSAYLQRLSGPHGLPGEQADPARFCREFWGLAFSPAPVTDERVLRELAPTMCATRAADRSFQYLVRNRIRNSIGTRWRLGDTLAAIRVPVLIVEGRPDEALLGQTGRRVAYLGHNNAVWASFLPDARVVPLRGEAWFPWVGRTGEAAAVLREFLGGAWPAVAQPALTRAAADSVVLVFRDRAGELARLSPPRNPDSPPADTLP